MLLNTIQTWIQRRQIQLKIVKIQLYPKLQLPSTATSTARAGRYSVQGVKITKRETVSLLKSLCDVTVELLQ